jgi:hypothetical protein
MSAAAAAARKIVSVKPRCANVFNDYNACRRNQ